MLAAIDAEDGATVEVGALLGTINAGRCGGQGGQGEARPPAGKPDEKTATTKPIAAGPEPVSRAWSRRRRLRSLRRRPRKILTEKGVAPAAVAGTGKDGRMTKADALAAFAGPGRRRQPAPVMARAPSPADGRRRGRRGSR